MIKQQHAGFSALELIISMMISAILMTAAFTIYNQISKGSIRSGQITQFDTQMMVLKDRLNSDLQGLTPLWFTQEHYEKLKTLKKKDPNAATPTTEQSIAGPKNKKRNNFLYAQSNENQFELLTFVTTNALQIYGDTVLRIVRVVYVLQPDEKIANTFKLMRKQDSEISADFDIEKLKTGSFNKIADHITHCSIEYGFIDKSSDKDSKDSGKPKEFKFVSQWGANNDSKQKNESTPTLPDIVKLTIKIKYSADQEAQTYELLCPIATSQTSEIKSFAEKRHDQEQKAKQQPSQPGGDGKNIKVLTPSGAIPGIMPNQKST